MTLCLQEMWEVSRNEQDVDIILMEKNKSLEFLCYGHLGITKGTILHLIVIYANTK